MGRYDRIITLGGACSPAWQVRAYTGQTDAFPFDWLVLPFHALTMAIEHDFHDFTAPDVFEATAVGIRHRKFPSLYLHDFQINHNPPDGWKDAVADVLAKYEFLIARWRNALCSRDRVLFVRHQGHFDDVEFKCVGALKAQEADRFCASLERHYPGLAFDVLFVDCVYEPLSHPRAKRADVGFDARADWPNPHDLWKGPTKRWQAVLGSVTEDTV